MKKNFLLLLMILLVSSTSLFFVGCSDDDDDGVIAQAIQQGWIIAEVRSYPYINFSADFMPISNTASIDSVVAGDSLCPDYIWQYWYVYGDNNYDYASYSNNADSLRFASGDTYTANFYTSNGMATGSVNVLHRTDDVPQYILPIDNDTLSLGSSINVIWNTVPNAEWYGLYVRYYKDSSNTYVTDDRTYFGTKDTSFTIDAVNNVYNGYYRIYIVAVTGPGPGDPINISGANWSGEFLSETNTLQVRVYLGTGDPTPVGNQDEYDIDDVNKISIAKEIKGLEYLNRQDIQVQTQ